MTGETNDELRRELEAAILRIDEQLQLLRSGPTIGEPADDRSLFRDLEDERAALLKARADLG